MARPALAWWLVGVLLVGGCATHSDRFAPVEEALLAGEPDRALEAVDGALAGREADAVLFHLERGMLRRMAGDYRASNADLEAAKGLMEELGAVSVSEGLGSLTVAEGVSSYVGAPHEQVLLHLVKAFNYLDLGRRDAARVEALQVDLRLQALADEAEGSVYDADPFARYLSGVLFEALGERSDALIAYRKAYRAYRRQEEAVGVDPPASLKAALLRLTDALGLDDEHAGYRRAFAGVVWRSAAEHARRAHVFFISGEGLAPVKEERSLNLQDAQGKLHRIAVPAYRSRPWRLESAGLTAGEERAPAVVAADVDAIARAVLDERMGAITARALARAVAKNAAVDEAADAHPLAGLALNVAGFASERADLRSWRTLPARYRLAWLDLPPGTYDLTPTFGGREGRTVEGVRLRAGEYHFLIDHWIAPGTGSVGGMQHGDEAKERASDGAR
ncbi:MAG: COG3014 family protein [Thiohalospira sp.]